MSGIRAATARFNDAAAVHRGCRHVLESGFHFGEASMMPRLFTADVLHVVANLRVIPELQ